MRPNILISVLDAVRAPNLSCYGHERETSPHIDRLAEGGRVFERAVPPAPATFDSVTSVLSGTYPCEHQSGRQMQVNVSHPLLPEVLSEKGYTTGFATSSPGTTPAFGYGAGIDKFYDVMNKYEGINVRKFFEETKELPKWRRYLRFFRQATDRNFLGNLRNAYRFRFDYGEDDGAREVTNAAMDFISSADEPWFLYLHYTETHMNKKGNTPYAVPEEYLTRFTGPNPDYNDLRSTSGTVDYDADQRDRHEKLYDGAIRYLDQQVGEIIDTLKDTGCYENTLCAVTSDHGEALGEKGYLGHGTLDEPVLQVPLVIRGPTVKPERVTERVNILGLYRTIARLVNTETTHTRGTDLLADIDTSPVLCQDFTETWDWSNYNGDSDDGKHAFYTRNFKLVTTPEKTALYDIEDDPNETTNLAERDHTEIQTIKSAFDEFVSELPTATISAETEIDSSMRRRLKDLGYID